MLVLILSQPKTGIFYVSNLLRKFTRGLAGATATWLAEQIKLHTGHMGKDGMTLSDELSELLMSLMPYEPAIYKKLYNVVWDYIKLSYFK
ncbi:hypothetical protein GASC598P17_005630 [Gilliamella apis SCGC AB-598-P17]|nr:hypothetical protein GASC598P17_005630 [Gilliamella apis SCGC AB-598-P17]